MENTKKKGRITEGEAESSRAATKRLTKQDQEQMNNTSTITLLPLAKQEPEQMSNTSRITGGGTREDFVDREQEAQEEQRIMRMMTGFISKLPREIIFDIFCRIPIKTLSQCRWVSKSWYKLIHLPHFAQIHLANATRIFSPCVTYFNKDHKQLYLIDHQVFDNHETLAEYHNIRFTGLNEIVEFVGSCNGLICLSSYNMPVFRPVHRLPYHIFNPITAESITVHPQVSGFDFFPRAVGFGFCPGTNEYKIVHIMKTGEAEIHTLGSCRWRRIGDVPYNICGRATFVNGALHWGLFENFNVSKGGFIVALDIKTEQFREIPLPPCSRPLFKCVGVLDGYLCVIDSDFDSHREIWVMKSYGVQDSWSKETVFRKFAGGSNTFWRGAYQVAKLKSGEWLLQRDGELNVRCCEVDLLHYYDPDKKVYERIVTRGAIHPDTMFLLPIVHAGSLISPKNIGRSTTRSGLC